MYRFVLIPDSFKGSITSKEACEIMRRATLRQFPDAQVDCIPIADGGEGTVDAFLAALGGKKVEQTVSDPYGEPINVYYGLMDEGKTAVIEMASCAGLPLVENQKDPSRTTTYGVGQLIRHALDSGCEKIILGLGGSATNDGGAGAAAALGVKFLSQTGEAFLPVGRNLHQIDAVDLSGLHPALAKVNLTAICDINNPLCGTNGAAQVFGPQKGANIAMIRLLDQGLWHFAQVLMRDTGIDTLNLPGAGVAGGMGAGVVALLGAKLQSGIGTMLTAVDFDTRIRNTDYIFTGEGSLDSQSLNGKAIAGIAYHAKQQGIPVIAVVGNAIEPLAEIYEEGVSAIFTTNRTAEDFSVSRAHCRENLERTMQDILRVIALKPRGKQKNGR